MTGMAAVTAGAPSRRGPEACVVRSRRGPPDPPPRTGPRRRPGRAGPSGPGRCWSWPSRPRPRCGPGGSASRRRPGSAWSPRCRASGLRCTWTPPSPSRSASRPTPRTRCAPGWPASARSAAGPAGSPSGRRSAPSRSAWPGRWPTTCWPRPGRSRAPWPVTTIVSCLPVLVLAMGTALAHMLRADADAAADAPDNGTGGPAVSRSPAWSAEDQAGAAQDQAAPQAPLAGSGPSAGTTTAPQQDHDARSSSVKPGGHQPGTRGRRAGSQRREGRYPDVPCAAKESGAPIRP